MKLDIVNLNKYVSVMPNSITVLLLQEHVTFSQCILPTYYTTVLAYCAMFISYIIAILPQIWV